AFSALALNPAHADDAACKGIVDAMMANTQTPYHSVGTITLEASGGSQAPISKSMPTETIFTGTEIFVKLPTGGWQNVHASLDDVKQRVRKAADSFKDCQKLADETDNGKNLAVYSGTTSNGANVVKTKIWVAPDRGVLMRTETDVTSAPQSDGEVRRQTLALRYDYDNIKPPANVQ
ncbi:MAG TPA: hypothetical protein VKV77_05405, partial [Methylovirgula sp.]|nr:hypothetical protein [Methylovirgula sp.]